VSIRLGDALHELLETVAPALIDGLDPHAIRLVPNVDLTAFSERTCGRDLRRQSDCETVAPALDAATHLHVSTP